MRDHFRDYHKEDIGGSKKRINKSGNYKDDSIDKAWLAACIISADWWRCAGCLKRQKVDSGGWECQYCKRDCEPDRIDARWEIQNEHPKASIFLSGTDIENCDADNHSEYLDRYSNFDAPPSATSYEDYQQGMEIADSERVVSLLWVEQELQDLFREGMQKTDSGRCEWNLRLALLSYSDRLRTQAFTGDERRAAQAMKVLAIEIAHLFRLRMDLQMDRIVHEGSKAKGGIQALAEDVLDEENMGEEEEFQELQTAMSKKDIDHQKLENFLRDSGALALQRQLQAVCASRPCTKSDARSLAFLQSPRHASIDIMSYRMGNT